MIELTRTNQASVEHGIKVLVYGQAGVGKTRLCATAPNPIIISAEAGLLSLKDYDIPVITINTVKDLEEAFEYVTSPEGEQYSTICLDSISEIGETILANAKALTKDGRKAYGELNEQAVAIIKQFRDLKGFNVYFSAKQEHQTDPITQLTKYSPSMPGGKLSQGLPYLFDCVLQLDIGTDEEGKLFRYLRTNANLTTIAKDRSGKLDEIEPADLNYIFDKIIGE